MRAGYRVARVYGQFLTEVCVVAAGAKVAEQRLADSDAIAVVTIFHGLLRRDWRWSSLGRSQTGDQKQSHVMESNVENQKTLSVSPKVPAPKDGIRASRTLMSVARNWN